MQMNIRRGDIYYADLSPVIGSEQGGLRPVLIIQNDVGNKFSPTVIAAAITSKIGKTKLPTHIDVLKGAQGCDSMGLARDSVILLEQIRTIDKRRLKEKMGHLDETMMNKVNDALFISFGLSHYEAITAEEKKEEADIAYAASTTGMPNVSQTALQPELSATPDSQLRIPH